MDSGALRQAARFGLLAACAMATVQCASVARADTAAAWQRAQLQIKYQRQRNGLDPVEGVVRHALARKPASSQRVNDGRITANPTSTKRAKSRRPKATVATRIQQHAKIIEYAARHYRIDPSLIRAVITQESSGQVCVDSPKGARGLMQLMPATAASLGVTDRCNAWQNIIGGTQYLRMLLNKYNNDLKLALAGYNAGPKAVAKYGGVPPYRETQNYIKRIMAMLEGV